MSSVAEFFHMGGYAFFVWSSYGIALFVLLLTFFMPMVNRKNIIKELRMKYRQQQRQQDQRQNNQKPQAANDASAD